jgi:hypothetical protein
VTPSSASPVLKTDVVIQLAADFPYTLSRDDFTVNATNSTELNTGDDLYDPITKYLKVIEVDDVAKTITAKFGGAWSGQYQMIIRHSQAGLIDSESLVLDVNTYVTSYSPTTGSIYGGTLITIDG